MGKGYDARTANAANVEERKRWTREDLRQMPFEAPDAMIHAAVRLADSHRPGLGEAAAEELAAVNNIEAWNEKTVNERRGRSVRELADEFQAGRFGTMQVLSRFTGETLGAAVRLANATVPASEFVKGLSRHT